MKNLNQFLFTLLLLSGLFLSCKKSETIQPDSPPQTRVTAPEPVYSTVFRDDFVDNRYFSNTKSDSLDISIASGSGFLSFNNMNSGYEIWQNVVIDTAKNFSISTTVLWKSGVNNYGYGLIWGVKDTQNSYHFQITENGACRVYKIINDQYSSLLNYSFTNNIKSGSNLLEVRKDGGQMLFNVNGNLVYKCNYLSLPGNGVGMGVTNTQTVRFEYLEVKQW